MIRRWCARAAVGVAAAAAVLCLDAGALRAQAARVQARVELVSGPGQTAQRVLGHVEQAIRAHGVDVSDAGDVTVEVQVARAHGVVAVAVAVKRGDEVQVRTVLQARSTHRLDLLIDRSLWQGIATGFAASAPAPAPAPTPTPAPTLTPAPAPTPMPAPTHPPGASPEADHRAQPGGEPGAAAAHLSAGADLRGGGATGPGLLGGALEATAGLRIYSRHLSYTDDLFHQLETYDLTAAPAVAGEGVIYPLALRPDWLPGRPPWLTRVGVAGAFCLSPGLDSTTATGAHLPTQARSWRLGLRDRVEAEFLARAHVALLVGLDYGRQSFVIHSADGMTKPPIPSVGYSWLRPSASLARSLGPVRGQFDLGYRLILRKGQIGGPAYFPHASVGAVDAQVAVRAPLPPRWVRAHGLSADLSIDLERYFYSLHPEPGDPWIAGGAIDQYVGVTLALSYVR